MKSFLAGVPAVIAAIGVAQAASPLSAYVGAARVLVVAAPNENDATMAEQIAAARRDNAGMKDRDLVVVRVTGPEARDDRGTHLDAAAIRRTLSLPADRFAAVLVGKDGGAKLRSDRAIPTTELFGTIDAMPMRRNEMRGNPSE